MLRRYRAVAINAACFAVALTVVLVLNLRGGSSSGEGRRYSWKVIRYTTSAKSLPESRGRCPGLFLALAKPALVVSHVAADGDRKWLDALAPKYHLCLYDPEAPLDEQSNQLQTPANRGHEAVTYLTFLIDNWDSIPAAGAVFVHGNRFAWHNDSPKYDNYDLLSTLNTSAALAENGYHNLRCDWSASTCNKAESPPQGSLETSMTSRLQPYNRRAVSDASLPVALKALFGHESLPDNHVVLDRAHTVKAQCCAQFVVSRERIWQHTREEYFALRQWLLDGSFGSRPDTKAAPSDDKIAGRVLSYVWHILFLQDPEGPVDLEKLNCQACPDAAQCYCRLYGRCNLPNCTPGRCVGQYVRPPTFSLPEDWEEKHLGL